MAWLDEIAGSVGSGSRGRRPLPMVGLRGAGEARLSPALKSRLRRRSDRQASRIHNPEIDALKAQKAAIDRALNAEVRDIEQTVGAVQSSLQGSLAGLKDAGLKGRFLKDAQSELVSRQGDLAQSIPYLTAEAQDTATAERMGLRSDIIGARVDREQAAAEKYGSLLDEARTDAEAISNRRRTRDREGGEGPDSGVKNAMIAAKDALTNWQQNVEVEGPDGEKVPVQELNPLATTADWRKFAVGLTQGYEGVNLEDAASVLNRLRRRGAAAPEPEVPEDRLATGFGASLAEIIRRQYGG